MDQMTFRALFEHSSLGIIISNEEGTILKTNPYASKIFGYDEGELLGKEVEVLIPPKLRDRHVTYRHDYIKDPKPRAMGSSLNLQAVKKDGSAFPVEVSLTFFRADGMLQIVSFVNDITERKRAETALLRLTEDLESKVNERTKELSDALRELSLTNQGLNQEMAQRKKVEAQIRGMLEKEKELNELKSRFVSMASHEFRTPLGGILSSAALIAKYPKTEDEPKREKHVQNIKKSVRNLTNILNDFLSLDKLEQGKVASTPVQFNFTRLVDDLAEEFRDTSAKHVIEVLHQGPELAMFQDKEMLRNLVTNLVSNALKYSPEGSTVTIRTAARGGDIVLEVEDRGIGIPPEDQKHLFERFFRAKNVTNVQGTGLGLNIVKRYLDLLGGRIEFKSEPNQGTTFTVTLPSEKK